MRILAYEYFSGGGLAGKDAPASLLGEGSAMLGALVADLAAIRGHRIVTTADPRFRVTVPDGVEVVTLSTGSDARLDELIASVDAAWFIAPETGGCLEGLAARAQRHGTPLLGSDSATIGRASDKAGLARCLADQGIPCPTTRVFGADREQAEWKAAAHDIGYPVVVKPGRGAGCDGVSFVSDESFLGPAVDAARQVAPRESLLLQQFVPGVAASVSLLGDGRRAMALAVNAQAVEAAGAFHYYGGTTPFDHPLAGQAVAAALRTCEAVGGLRGYVGVDLVLSESEAVVIEINPRLTTGYLGVRAAFADNVAALALAACDGGLPPRVPARRRVRFTSGGRIVSSTPVLQ